MLLRHLGLDEAAACVDEAVVAALAAGVRTPDVGGSGSTEEVGAWIAERVAASAQGVPQRGEA
jgi:isocitrate/isopropylmalate dehydrogenase